MIGERNRLMMFTSVSEGFEKPSTGMYSMIYRDSR